MPKQTPFGMLVTLWLIGWTFLVLAMDVNFIIQVGRPVVAFNDSLDLANSALDRRLESGSWFLALLLTPFNLVMLGGWIWLRRHRQGWLARLIRTDGRHWIVQRTLGDPWLTGVVVAVVISVCEILPAGPGRWQDDLTTMLVLWAILLSVTGVAIWHARRTRYFEPPRLICDLATGSVTWPARESSADGQTIAVSQWRRTELDDCLVPDTSPDEPRRFTVRLVFDAPAGGESSRDVLVTDNGLEAAALAEWLNEWFQSRASGQTVPEPATRLR